ncbi:MAG: class IV adenylate cyclase [Candidatus Hodarchaeales archaeon]|jgi:predicted adenylyl cyclase CyaB
MAAKVVNFEFKAKCKNQSKVISYLEASGAQYKGLDHQIDTYFNVKFGRMKLREGKIENFLIWYKRPNKKESKKSEVILFKPGSQITLKEILTASLGVLAVVEKKRRIYFLNNVKFHVDSVKSLGSFIEVEAQGVAGDEQSLRQQCEYYKDQLQVAKNELIDYSYSDLILKST